jgi:hypothetical protein
MDKIKIKLDDPKTRAIWNAVQQAKAEVERWPPSKRGEDGPRPAEPGSSPPSKERG